MRELGGVQAGGPLRRARGGAARAGFSLGGTAASAAAGLLAGEAVAGIGLGLLAAQESAEAPARDAAARARAEGLLEELTGLQRDLLRGRRDPGRLERLAALEAGEEGADPALREAVRAIALRARLELARRGWEAPPTR